MKKLVLTMVALVAMATASFAQSPFEDMIRRNLSSRSNSSYSVPSVTYSVPKVTYSTPSVNYNTTSVSGYYRSNGTHVQSHVRTMPNSTNWDNFSTLLTTMEQVTPFIAARVEVSTISTAAVVRPTSQSVNCGNHDK